MNTHDILNPELYKPRGKENNKSPTHKWKAGHRKPTKINVRS